MPSPTTVRYGGHTSCVEVRSDTGACLVIDAGTGLRGLGQKLADEQASRKKWEHHLMLSHVHWDHIQGLPFFEPAYIEGTKINVYAMRAAADELRNVIGGITRHEFFPVPLDQVPADFEYHEVNPGKPMKVGGFDVMPFSLNHPFGAVGYRIAADGTSMAYCCDTAPFDRILHKQHFLAGPEELSDDDSVMLGALRRGVVDALQDVDTVIYDTHFLPEEYEKFPHYGHSTPDHALEICSESGVRRLVLYHHAPGHDDDTLDGVDERYREIGLSKGIEVVTAKEKMILAVGQTTDPGVGA